MISYRIKRHRQRRHGANHFALIPFIDMMTILVVFLLAHTAEVDILPNTKNISIPQSLSERKPSAAVVVMITKDSVYVDGQLVGSVSAISASQGPFFAPLKDALMAQNDRSVRTAAQTDIAKRVLQTNRWGELRERQGLDARQMQVENDAIRPAG